MTLAFQLLDARRLHLGALPGGTEFAVEALPVLLPAGQFGLRRSRSARRLLLARAPHVDQGFKLGNLGVQRRQLLLVARDKRDKRNEDDADGVLGIVTGVGADKQWSSSWFLDAWSQATP